MNKLYPNMLKNLLALEKYINDSLKAPQNPVVKAKKYGLLHEMENVIKRNINRIKSAWKGHRWLDAGYEIKSLEVLINSFYADGYIDKDILTFLINAFQKAVQFKEIKYKKNHNLDWTIFNSGVFE